MISIIWYLTGTKDFLNFIARVIVKYVTSPDTFNIDTFFIHFKNMTVFNLLTFYGSLVIQWLPVSKYLILKKWLYQIIIIYWVFVSIYNMTGA